MEPLVAFRRSVDQLGELRPDPFRKRDGVCAALAGYAARHANGTERLSGRRMRLLEMVDLADMLGRMRELETDALAMPAGREAPAPDHRHLVRHAGMRRIVGDGVDLGWRHDLT